MPSPTETARARHMVHPWETAGLGLPPYRVTGTQTVKYQACPGAPIQPGTCCDYCGQGIMLVASVADREGKRFKVGFDCVQRAYQGVPDLSDADRRVLHDVDKARRAHQRQARKARDAARDKRTDELLQRDDVRAALKAQPHPNEWRAEQGDTLLDWCEWMMANAGASGRGKVAKALRGAA